MPGPTTVAPQFSPVNPFSTQTTTASPFALAAIIGEVACTIPICVGAPQVLAARRFTQVLEQLLPKPPSRHATKPTPWLVSAADETNISVKLSCRLLMRSKGFQPGTGVDPPPPPPGPGCMGGPLGGVPPRRLRRRRQQEAVQAQSRKACQPCSTDSSECA